MKAAFFTAKLVGEPYAAGAASGEEPLHWLTVEEARSHLHHVCHAWAVDEVL